MIYGHKESLQNKKTLNSISMQHNMPHSLLFFAVPFTPETFNFGTFGKVAHPS